MQVDYIELMKQLQKWVEGVIEIQVEQQKGSFDHLHSQICIDCIQSAIDIVNDNTIFDEGEFY